jgi:amino acid transporter
LSAAEPIVEGQKAMSDTKDNSIGFWEAAAIGVGGMVGGGIFAVLGLSVQQARGGSVIAFAIAGLVALLTAYSYARLSVTFPSQGGTVTFLDRAFGSNAFIGSINILLWQSYIVMLSLYAYAFGSYGATFGPAGMEPLLKHVLMSAGIVLISILNVFGARVIGEAEGVIVAVKLAILLVFVGVGVFGIQMGRMAPAEWASPVAIVAGGMLIFLAYEGFELIANTANDVKNPKKTLPRAYFGSVIFVIVLYILVAAVTIGNLPVSKIVGAEDYALAEAAKPFLGTAGFILIAIAAVLSTASAINATIYGAARLSYTIAKDGELPLFLERKVWRRGREGLLITSGITLVVANLFDLSSISMMGSAGFLVIFAIVNIANVRLHRQTNSRAWISAAGAAACIGALAVLLWHTAKNSPTNLVVLAAMAALAFSVEAVYRIFRRRAIHVA